MLMPLPGRLRYVLVEGVGAMGGAVYDRIGVGYTAVRQPDPRIEARIWSALAGVSDVVNVGAGAGSYEVQGRVAVAVEPSAEMVTQRPSGSAPVVRACAEQLPFRSNAFDGAMAILTVHHWTDPVAGLREIRRVTDGPVAVFTFDRSVHNRMWLADYLPAAVDLDPDHLDSTEIAHALGGGHVEPVLVPHDCVDGFAHAYWRRPDAYLMPAVRAGISSFARLPDDIVDTAIAKLRADIDSGRWAQDHADLLELSEYDGGFRLVIAP
jgi:SAM-dependent methyltransferase